MMTIRDHMSGPLRRTEKARHHAGNTAPVLRFARELASTGPGDRIKPGFPVVLRGAPARLNPAPLQQPHERRVHRSLVELQHVFAHLLDAPRDPVAVLRAQRLERLQDHEIERALQDVPPIARGSFGHAKGVAPCLWDVNRSDRADEAAGSGVETEKAAQTMSLFLERATKRPIPRRVRRDVAEVRLKRPVPQRDVSPADDTVAPQEWQRVVTELAPGHRRVRLEAIGPAPEDPEPATVPHDRTERGQPTGQPGRAV